MPNTFNILGRKVRSSSQRRYIVIAVRAMPYDNVNGTTYHPFHHFVKRSDNLITARKAKQQYGSVLGGVVVIMDSITGQEV